MDFFQFLKWDLLKSRLLALWIEPHELEGVDFNNIEQLNQLAEKIGPKLIKKNPRIASMIKQNSGVLGPEKQKEVTQVIDAM